MDIDSDNAAIEKNLRFLETTIIESGGYIDPELLIRCEDGNLSVEKHGLHNPSKPLIALPGDLLLPSEKMGLGVKNGTLTLSPDKTALSGTQIKLAESMIELYNLTDKIANHKKACCWFLFRNNVAPLEKLLEAREINEKQKKFLAFTKGEDKAANEDDLLCDTYIKTRTIGHKQVDASDDEITMTTDIMPIVDFINHHHGGACFNFNKKKIADGAEKEFLFLNDNRPLPDSNECFAYYNQMDALDSFIAYGFPDSYAAYVRSVPTEFEIPKTGKVIVRGLGSGLRKGKLHKSVEGLRPYIPNTVSNDENTLEISHLLIPTNKYAPNALRRVLRLIISNRVAVKRNLTPDEIWQTVLLAEEKIIDDNIVFYKNLLKDLNGKTPEEKMVRMVAELQLTKLYKYAFDENHFSRTEQTGTDISAAGAAE